jgi:pilus assembly protein Flp/PilA
MSKLVAFSKDETGATAIEYGLIAAGISVVIIASVNAIGLEAQHHVPDDFRRTEVNFASTGMRKPPETAASCIFKGVLWRRRALAASCADRVLEPVVPPTRAIIRLVRPKFA